MGSGEWMNVMGGVIVLLGLGALIWWQHQLRRAAAPSLSTPVIPSPPAPIRAVPMSSGAPYLVWADILNQYHWDTVRAILTSSHQGYGAYDTPEIQKVLKSALGATGVDPSWLPGRARDLFKCLFLSLSYTIYDRQQKGLLPDTDSRAHWEARLFLQGYALGLHMASDVYEKEQL